MFALDIMLSKKSILLVSVAAGIAYFFYSTQNAAIPRPNEGESGVRISVG